MLHVLIPVFNNAEGVAASIRSIPDDERFRAIVVDNASDDATATVLAHAEVTRTNVQIVRNPQNVGRVGNWNRCLEVAEQAGAQHILFVMAGDELLAEEAGRLCELLARSAAADFLGTVTLFPIVQRSTGKTVVARRLSDKGIADRAAVLRMLFRYGVPFLGPLQACIVSASDARFGRFDEAVGQYHTDQDFVLTRVLRSDTVIVADFPVTAMNMAQRKTHGTIARGTLLRQDVAFMDHIHRRAHGGGASPLRRAGWRLFNAYRYFVRQG